MKKVCSLVLALAMMLSIVSTSALTIVKEEIDNPPEELLPVEELLPEEAAEEPEEIPEPELTTLSGELETLDENPWNLVDADCTDYTAKLRRVIASTPVQEGTLTQMDGYVNITRGDDKSNTVATGGYTWLASLGNIVFPTSGFVTAEVSARLGGAVSGKANEISIRINGQKVLYRMFLKWGTVAQGGGIASISDYSDLVPLDTTVWHNYALVINAGDKTYDIYVDGAKIIENGTAGSLDGGHLLRIGADSNARCNMDVESVRAGTGDLTASLSAYDGASYPETRLVMVEPDEAEVLPEDVLSVTVHGQNYTDATDVTLTLLDGTKAAVNPAVTATGSISAATTEMNLTMPENLSAGVYYIKAEADSSVVYSEEITVLSDAVPPELPTFVSVGYTIEMADYAYNPTYEFNFPSIVDTKAQHPDGLNGYRYYLFYAPHDAPAGNCVAMSNSLDGPWVEYANNPVVGKVWDGHYSVSHVSSPHIIWNDIDECYYMYFHGENPTTRYATSTDLVNWTYGDVCVVAKDFSPQGNEASYARVFEHEVQGLDNKYIMLLMINHGSGHPDAGMRKIYWAHSKDGKEWTAVTTPLLTPNLAHFKGNFSGPWFMEWDGRYFVICHSSGGDMHVFEVGASLDRNTYLGEVYESMGTKGNDEDNPLTYPDYARAGAPYFIQDDDERWHMFYEGGRRLHANIVHAVEVKPGEENQLARINLQAVSPMTEDAKKPIAYMSEGATAQPEIYLFDKSDKAIAADAAGLTYDYFTSDTSVLTYADGTLTAVGGGHATAWLEGTLNGITVTSIKLEVEVAALFPTDGALISAQDAPNRPASSACVELPSIFHAGKYLTDPIDEYYLYFNYSNSGTAGRKIALATAHDPAGPWTVYQDGTAVMELSNMGHNSNEDIFNSAWPIWDSEHNRMLMYYAFNNGVICVSQSTDGVHFSKINNTSTTASFDVAFRQQDVDGTSRTYQQSVYEYTIPGKDNKFVMLYTGYAADGLNLFYAWSTDGLAWTQGGLLLAPEAEDNGNISSPRLLEIGDELRLVYHNSTGKIMSASLNADLTVKERLGVYYAPFSDYPDRGRAADAAFFSDGADLYMYYTAGSQTGTTFADGAAIACTKTNLGTVVLEESFDGAAPSWTPASGTWTATEGGYLQSSTSGGAAVYFGEETWTDYEIQVDVTPLAKKDNEYISVMVAGRVSDALPKRYTATYNPKNRAGKELFIQRTVSSATILAPNAPFTMEIGKTYTLTLRMVGNKITMYVDGVKQVEVTDDYLTNGRVGLLTNNTSATFDNVIIRDFSNPALPSESLKLNDFSDHQVIQRNPTTENAEITISGTVAGEFTGTVEARVLAYRESTAVVDWTNINATFDDGAWSGTLTVPQGGWYQLEVRLKDTAGNIAGSAIGKSKWGVGMVILCIGQSNMVGQGAKPYTVADDLVANFTRSGRWAHLTDPYDGAGGSLVPALGNKLVAALNIPVAFIPAANSGSGLHAPNPYSNHKADQYWMYYDEVDPTSTMLYGTALKRVAAAGGKIELAVWNQGETDGALNISQEVYEADMKLLLQRFREDLAMPDLSIFLCQIGTHDTNISTDDNYTLIRNAQDKLDDGSGDFYMAATEMEFARKDTAHYTQPGLDEIGRRVAHTILYSLGEETYYRGPSITSADYVNNDRSVIDVTITHRGGTDITPATGITGFIVLDGTSKATITSAVRQDATTIRLTLSQPIAVSGRVRYLYGLNPDVSNIVKDNTPMALPLETTTADLYIGDDEPVEPGEPSDWDIIDDAMGPDWKAESWRESTKTGTFTQYSDYLNITKPNESDVGADKLYHWAVSPTSLALPRDGFTMEVTARVAGTVEGEANEIGVRMGEDSQDTNGKLASFFLGYGTEGFVSASASATGKYFMVLDTTQWHDYRIVVRLDEGVYVYDMFVDGALAFEGAPLVTYKGGDLIRMGADNPGRCNLDVKHVKLGTGEILPEGFSSAKITKIELSALSQKETESKTVTVTVTGSGFENGDEVTLTLVDMLGAQVGNATAEGTFTDDKAVINLTIPAGLPVNRYSVMAQTGGRTRYSETYNVVVDGRTAPVFPTFAPEGYTIDMDDYIFNPTEELNFPSIVDTKDHPVAAIDGVSYRYFLYYAPHDNPGGNCVAMSNSLNGPWVEYANNPVVGNVWAKDDGSGENWYSVSHVSSPHVMWNDLDECYYMYFHGENPITRYATSDDLIHWTYGGICVNANDFSTGESYKEASYARVFEHEVPGLNNKYIMVLMISNSGTFSSSMRQIFWAHSPDGKNWTAVQTPLLTPEFDEEYKGNLSGAFFLPWEGRYYIIAHASSGNMYTFEVGESLNEEVHWGMFYESRGLRGTDDEVNDDYAPDYGRAGAPCFIQDDDGVWHMYYEAGKRLHANIVHAVGTVEEPPAPPTPPTGGSGSTVKTTVETLPDGTKITTKTNTATGTVTVTTEYPDGSKTVAETRKDGTVTETLTKPDGTKAVTETDAKGEVTTEVTLPETVGQTVINTPAGSGNVAVLVHDDGTEETLTIFELKNGRLTARVNGSGTIKIVERRVTFSDTVGTAAHEAACTLAARGIFLGTAPDTFSPDMPLSRAMMVTLLYRIDGAPVVETPVDFADVPQDAWFAEATAWAQERGITIGVGGGYFAPEAALTWEQVALMLYRYAGTIDIAETTADNELEAALAWCAEKGVGVTLSTDGVTRGELAQILDLYIKALLK